MVDKKRTDISIPGPLARPRLDWDDLRYFIELAERGTLSATARALRVNHATVSRRLAHLEGTLGRTLFHRRPEGYLPTADGEAILAEATKMDQAAMALLRRLEGRAELAGLVRLTTTRAFADGFLAERLGPFRQRCPAIDLELLTGTRNMSLGRREADIALRMARPKAGEMIARRVGRFGFGFYASAGCRDEFLRGDDPGFIAFDEASAGIPEAAWLTQWLGGRRVVFRGNSQLGQRAAAMGGVGIALLPHFLAENQPDLLPLDLGDVAPEREIWLLFRRDLAKTPRVRAVADYLVEIIERDAGLLVGSV